MDPVLFKLKQIAFNENMIQPNCSDNESSDSKTVSVSEDAEEN